MVKRYEDVQREAEATVKSWLTVYFNENDKYPAQWLRNLFPDSTVDDRSIKDVRPTDTDNYLRCHFFAGIGGWEYALQLAGWPADREVWTGSCPCQPFSQAGKRKGTADDRHLWPDFYRLISERLPATIFGEQVASADGREWLSGVRVDLEALGYAVGASDLCAAGVGAPHIRQRLYWVANCDRSRKGVGTRAPRVAIAGDPCWVENSLIDLRGEGRTKHEGRWSLGNESANAGNTGAERLGNASEQRSQGRLTVCGGDEWTFRATSLVGRLPDSDSFSTEPDSDEGWCAMVEAEPSGESTASGGWLDWGNVAIPCADGKYRRVEPSILPLAHGIPNRVGRIRAYGNAIVPQVAAKFIRAFLETE